MAWVLIFASSWGMCVTCGRSLDRARGRGTVNVFTRASASCSAGQGLQVHREFAQREMEGGLLFFVSFIDLLCYLWFGSFMVATQVSTCPKLLR